MIAARHAAGVEPDIVSRTMLLALMVCCAVACAPRTEQDQQATDVGALVITNVHVVPMDTERVLRRHAVVVRRGVIEAVGPEEDIAMPADARQVDGRGAYRSPLRAGAVSLS